MIYLKINEDGSIMYPYSLTELRNGNPNTSFPRDLTPEILLGYNVYIVYRTNHSDDYTKNYIEGIPEIIDGVYKQTWIITDATSEEIEQRKQQKWSEIRSMRNRNLSECDWTQLPDSPLTPEKKQEWVTYRQELRDVTLQPDPFNITWPTKPE